MIKMHVLAAMTTDNSSAHSRMRDRDYRQKEFCDGCTYTVNVLMDLFFRFY